MLGLSVDEAGAESSFQAYSILVLMLILKVEDEKRRTEIISASEAVEEIIVPCSTASSSSLLGILHCSLLHWRFGLHFGMRLGILFKIEIDKK